METEVTIHDRLYSAANRLFGASLSADPGKEDGVLAEIERTQRTLDKIREEILEEGGLE